VPLSAVDRARPRRRTRSVLAPLVAAGLALAPAANAQIVALDLSNDLTWSSGAGAIDDEGVRRLTPPSDLAAIGLGPLPASVDVTAYHPLEDGRRLFALDQFVDLGGGLFAGPEDVIALGDGGYSIELDGSAAGVPAGARIDALASVRIGGARVMLLSFDVTVSLPGGLVADDEDVVSWVAGSWASVFDGSASGVAPGLDLDGVDFDRFGDRLYLSFDGSGEIGGVAFDDEDALALSGSVWSLALDASASLGASFAAGDLDAPAIRAVAIFLDDFESADTIEWSFATP
jgi:hypothetical protein